MTDNSEHHERFSRQRNFPAIAVLALVIAVISLLLNRCAPTNDSANPTPTMTKTICPTPSPGATGANGTNGTAGKDGLSAYDLWLGVGNKGSIKDFLTSLIGKQGPKGAPGENYYGSDGVTHTQSEPGVNGVDGLSAYQLWLNAGNTGTVNDFLTSLIGPAGANGINGVDGTDGLAGANGLSAYDLWVALGNSGSEQNFFDSLAGVPGTDGTPGSPGQSAYDIWVANGNNGTEGQFLASLVGPQGVPGAPGLCTIGETGATGATGASAYQVWLSQNNVGSEQVFLASLVGPQGDQGLQGEQGLQGIQGETGPRGATGDTGQQGPPGTGGLGYFGYFYDMTNQQLNQITPIPQAWSFSNVNSGNNNGISIVDNGNGRNTRITFPATGWYNIAFSTVFSKSTSNSDDVDVWFAENGNNIADSNTRLTIAGQSQTVAAWNYFYHCKNVNDYVEVMWYTTAYNNISVVMDPASTSPSRPAVPSIILTVNQVN